MKSYVIGIMGIEVSLMEWKKNEKIDIVLSKYFLLPVTINSSNIAIKCYVLIWYEKMIVIFMSNTNYFLSHHLVFWIIINCFSGHYSPFIHWIKRIPQHLPNLKFWSIKNDYQKTNIFQICQKYNFDKSFFQFGSLYIFLPKWFSTWVLIVGIKAQLDVAPLKAVAAQRPCLNILLYLSNKSLGKCS